MFRKILYYILEFGDVFEFKFYSEILKDIISSLFVWFFNGNKWYYVFIIVNANFYSLCALLFVLKWKEELDLFANRFVGSDLKKKKLQ